MLAKFTIANKQSILQCNTAVFKTIYNDCADDLASWLPVHIYLPLDLHDIGTVR